MSKSTSRQQTTGKAPNRPSPGTNQAGSDAQQAEKIRRALKLLEPLIEFHDSVEGATASDLRIYWDVRVVRAERTPFARVTGSSSLPQALAHNTRVLAPGLIQQEVRDKITTPLTALLQTEVENQTLAELAARAQETGGKCTNCGHCTNSGNCGHCGY